MSEKNNESIAEGLFFGQINEDQLFPFPSFTKDQVEMAKTMTEAINRYADDNIDGAKFDRDGKVPEEVLKGLGELGLCGLGVEEKFGGMELDSSLYARVFSEIAGIDGSIATMLGAHQSIGFKALMNEGTDEQKEKFLPSLATGEKFAAFCLTEPGSGSDAYSIKTKAKDNGDGTFTLNGQKLWITNAGFADFYTVFAKTDHDKDGENVEKISCFIVEKDAEGLSFGEKEDKMGIRASETRAVYFDNVIIPKENIIGELGKGFKIAMNVLNTGRLSLGSGSVGGMKIALKHATAHAKARRQFGKTITEFGLIQDKLSYMSSQIYACESMVYFTTGKMVQGLDNYAIESAICKVYCSESLWSVVDTAMQIAAGNGYMKEYPYERLIRDSRINLIFEGTNEILRCFIALMGIKGPSEDLKELGKLTDVSGALSDPIKSLGVLGDFAKKRLGKIWGNRSLTRCHKDLEVHASKFSSMLGDFSIQVENVLFKYGKKIIDHELPQKRLAEMAMELYAYAAVLSRTSAILVNDKADDKKKDYVMGLTNIALKNSRHRFLKNLREMVRNNDKIVRKTSDYVVEFDGHGLDVIDY